ncbi:hypothetical protein HNQ07_003438 [Deinococcus metalli]|uniref:Uncharacterized protein n=1 Tax=Deinococcus metalli TaxID=1141878 RepID=A0A7W8KHL0_9DEIO|nr:hypothetical protein [Deinococcus metalli]MBB5377938.1 hypothetical protein [Deinococcus metalli]GHF54992.1 hypothetical protein GCM10017781_33970 [Deinococcus metalli]
MSLNDLKQNHMMAHLTQALDDGQDIGHYGRLVYAIVARHFLSDKALAAQLAKDSDFTPEAAQDLVRQVQDADYSPPRRDTILEYMGKQDFPILPDASDPDEGNVYRDLEFPQHVYDHIQQYHHQKAE